MLRRLVLLTSASALSLLLAGPVANPSAALGDPAPTDPASTITGWTGGSPRPVAMTVSSSGRATAVFTTEPTTLGSDGATIWVASRPDGGAWSAPSAVATGADPASVSFAEQGSGASVLVWDAAGTQVDLVAVRRASDTAAWSAPVTLASDATLAHRPVVGMSDDDVPMLAYLHDAGDGTQAETRQWVSGAWADPVQHSTAPAHQVDLRVSANGTALLAWSQDAPDGKLSLSADRYLGSTHTWDPTELMSGDLVPGGLLDVAADSGDEGAVAFTEHTLGGSSTVSRLWYSYPTGSCESDCPAVWHVTSIGSSSDHHAPSMALADRSGIIQQVSTREETDHTRSVSFYESNGTGPWQPSVRLSNDDGSDDSDVTASRHGRTVATWTQHTDQGDALVMRTVEQAVNGHVAGNHLRVLGASPVPAAPADSWTRDAYLMWVDPSSGSPVIRTVEDSASNTPPIVDPGMEGSSAVMAAWAAGEPDGTEYDVRTRQATPRQDFGSAQLWQSRTTQTSATYHAARGRTVCFSSRSYATGAASAWSGDSCRTVALDERSLDASHWTGQRGSAYYAGTRLTTRRGGARLSLSSVRTRTVSLLVSRRPGNGRLRVSLGGHRLGTVSTGGARGDRVVLPVAHFRNLHRGRLVLTVVGSGRPVSVDGVFLGPT